MSLLNQTVTVYRADGTRKVLENCYLAVKHRLSTDHCGTCNRNSFTLIVRGSADLRPGDRLMPGIGPETVTWERLLPETGPVYRVGYAQPFFWNGRISHMEAGGTND